MTVSSERTTGRRNDESLAEQIRRRGLTPPASLDELRANVWESDEELDAFLNFVRLSRNADLSHP